MSKDQYEYILTYIDGDKEVSHTFSAFCTGEEMRSHLRGFLAACSWLPESIDKILGEDDV